MMDNIPQNHREAWTGDRGCAILFFMDDFKEKKREEFKGEWFYVIPTEAFSQYVEHPQVRRLYLTDVGFFPNAEHHYKERKEGIEEYIFIYCMEGCGEIELLGDRKYVLRENQAFCIPRSAGHRYYACRENPWTILWVHFKGEDCPVYPLEERRIVSFTSKSASGRMMFYFELLLGVLGGNYTLGNFIYISQVLGLILSEAYFREKAASTVEQNKHMTKVVRYLYRHLDENLTLDKLSSEFEFSKSYLNAIFQKYSGHSPMDFFIRLKMKEACKLLRSTNLYIYQVGQQLGYRDAYYFSRIFKKVVGISPKEYRESDYMVTAQMWSEL